MHTPTVTRRVAIPLIATGATAAFWGSAGAEETDVDSENTFPVYSPDLASLKKAMKTFVVKWWAVEFGNYTYYFCREELPYSSVSRYNFHGWYKAYGEDDERLFHIWSFRSYGGGDIELKIDEKGGIVTVLGLERKLKGKQLGMFSLAAARP